LTLQIGHPRRLGCPDLIKSVAGSDGKPQIGIAVTEAAIAAQDPDRSRMVAPPA
jgi:hypothetical protein